MEIHREIWNNDIVRPELPLSPFNCNLCRVYTTSWVLRRELAAHSKQPELIQRGVFLRHDIWENSQNLHKEVFHRTWYMVRKDNEEVRSSSVSSAVSVRPRYQFGEKHHQIRAYILLYEGFSSETPSQRIFPTTISMCARSDGWFEPSCSFLFPLPN